jgi:hypothetical protein
MRQVKAFLTQAFLLIAEPRVIRIIMFLLYAVFLTAGYLVVTKPSESILDVLGGGLAMVFGIFLTIGGVLGFVAVLPGVWWLERTGIIACAVGLAMYVVIVLTTASSSLGFPFAILLTGFLAIRWIEIRRYQLAPRG